MLFRSAEDPGCPFFPGYDRFNLALGLLGTIWGIILVGYYPAEQITIAALMRCLHTAMFSTLVAVAWVMVLMPAAVLPLLLIFIFAFAVSLDVNELAVGISVEDDSPEAASFVEAFTSSRYFKVRSARDRRELVPALTAGDIRGIVVIPGDFASRLGNAAGPAAPVQIITDGSEPNTANFVQNYARGAWQVWLRQRALDGGRAAPAPVTVVDRVWYNPELESRNFLLPGALALIMTLIGTLLTALVVAREWERGTMEALLSTSITRGALILGKLLPYFLLGMLSLFLSVSAMVLLFHVPLRGSFLVLSILS